ncbi:hypothetical protein HQ43_07865 [Porphyromonas canoris]|uniref:Uncharacterized protein n=1 Tax=Porphyromonas canoris TaxID=36875 RepID=A0ABR4XJU4_9PORP|nr:hypothetical protein HQ43_07865 [Porphyromonas canoris]
MEQPVNPIKETSKPVQEKTAKAQKRREKEQSGSATYNLCFFTNFAYRRIFSIRTDAKTTDKRHGYGK